LVLPRKGANIYRLLHSQNLRRVEF